MVEPNITVVTHSEPDAMLSDNDFATWLGAVMAEAHAVLNQLQADYSVTASALCGAISTPPLPDQTSATGVDGKCPGNENQRTSPATADPGLAGVVEKVREDVRRTGKADLPPSLPGAVVGAPAAKQNNRRPNPNQPI